MSDTEYTKDPRVADIILVTCIPVAHRPNLPDTDRSKVYEVVKCQVCGRDIWLGSGAKELANKHHNARVMCVFCVLDEYGVEPLRNLTTHDEITGKSHEPM